MRYGKIILFKGVIIIHNTRLALQLSNILIQDHFKLHPELLHLTNKIKERLDLPNVYPEHKFTKEEALEIEIYLKSTNIENKSELIDYVYKVYRHGDL